MKTRLVLSLYFFALAASAALAGAPAFTTEGFAVPQAGRPFTFPRDHGSHPEFKIEWWYLTGHLYAPAQGKAAARRFGFQATFFRQAGPLGAPENSTLFGTTQLFLAHMALTDVQTGKFISQERLNRNGWDANSALETLAVHNGSWSLRLADPADPGDRPTLQLQGGVQAEAVFTLTMRPTKSLVVFGEDGVSRKGADATAASHYLTFPRLAATGELTLHTGDKTEVLPVAGEAWMDHEISSSQLSAGQIGWDWLSVQLNDGRELMLYQLRRRDGSIDPASSLTWVDRSSATQRAAFKLEVIDQWTSPVTRATYPSRIRLTTTDPATQVAVVLIVEPLVKAQELPGPLGGIPYWEGACRVQDTAGIELGSAYLELTGYAKELKL